MKLTPLTCTALALLTAVSFVSAGDPYNVYSSGSTGADGPFAPEFKITMEGTNLVGAVPAGTVLIGNRICIPFPTNGLFNFTTINIPANYIVCFSPIVGIAATMLATGDITIAGTLSVAAEDSRWAHLGHDSTQEANAWIGIEIAGPGGFAGGTTYGSYSSAGGGPFGYPEHSSGEVGFCLPLLGGSGGSGSDWGNGGGGGGTLYLASSTSIRFIGKGQIDFSGNSLSGAFRGYRGGTGMAALFANEISGTPSSTDNNRMLLSAMRHEVYTPMSIYPMWHVGVTGNRVPRDPVVEVVKFGDLWFADMPHDQKKMWELPSPGKYTILIQTRDLPPGISFEIKNYLLATDGKVRSIDNYATFNATVEVSPGVCQAKAEIEIKSGEQRLYVTATEPIKVAMAPLYEGSRIRNMCLRVDDSGKSWIGFETEKGVVLSYDAAMTLARQQQCLGFVLQYASSKTKS